MNKVKFQHRIDTDFPGQPATCNFIETVAGALDVVRSLSLEESQRPHWERADSALWQAVECPDDSTLLLFAEQAFRDALKVEGWLKSAG